MAAPRFFIEAPDIAIRNGIAFVEVDGTPICCMAVGTLRVTKRRADAALAVFDFPPANVVALERRGGDH